MDDEQGRIDDIGECFTKDTRVDFEGAGVKHGREAVVAELSRRRQGYRERCATPWHVTSTTLISEEGEDSATAHSWVMGVLSSADQPPVISQPWAPTRTASS